LTRPIFVCPKYVDRLMLPNGLIKDRIEKVAIQIIESFENDHAQSISMICVLKGGFKFFADLIDALERTIRARGTPIPIATDFVRVKSYNAQSGPSIYLSGVENVESYRGKDILIVEDIVDTGRTMSNLNKYLRTLNARSVLAGFEIPDEFVVGYALDYNDYFRDLHVGFAFIMSLLLRDLLLVAQHLDICTRA
uniref:Pribosyltran domain-containing protein n=1 Tax=Schistocephalus solidus TaxID=70667 RepID=A0A183TLE1_SCHSO